MTSLDHGKFTRVTTTFHSLLGLDVFILFFTGYSLTFNDELWWLLSLLGGPQSVTALHRAAGFGLIALIGFWMTLMITTDTGRGNFREIIPSPKDLVAFIQDVQFALGRADERHPNAKQFAGGDPDEIPLLSYIGKGVVFIFAAELFLLTVSGLLIWSKTGLMQYFGTKTAAMGFVVFHGLLGVVMLMGVMLHIFEHGLHPAFYPVEPKAYIPRELIPETHADGGIEDLTLSPSWRAVSTVMGTLTVVGITSVMIGSIFDEGYPVPREIAIGGGPESLLLTIGINAGILVLFIGLVLSMYGNLLRVRWERRLEEERGRPTAADGGTTDGGATDDD
jgi:cytochrome b subunit of formate dehydrogenase